MRSDLVLGLLLLTFFVGCCGTVAPPAVKEEAADARSRSAVPVAENAVPAPKGGDARGGGDPVPTPPSVPGLSPEDWECSLQEQARLWKEAEQLRRQGKLAECRETIGRLLAAEKDLFGDATHTQLYGTEYLAAVQDADKDPASARKTRLEAAALQLRFLGDRPTDKAGRPESIEKRRRLEQAVEVRSRELGPGDRLVGLTLVDLALAQESDGRPDAASASLERALALFKAINPSYPPFSRTDANYHLDRIHFLNAGQADGQAMRGRLPDSVAQFLEEAKKRSAEAERCEASGDAERARTLLRQNLRLQGFGGGDLACSEDAQMELARSYHALLSRYLSFEGRAGAAGKAAEVYASSISNFKGAIYTHQRAVRLERWHPSMKPFFDAYDEATRRLAVLAERREGTDGAPSPEVRSLIARRDALEAEMGRRRTALPQFLNAPVPDLLPPGAVLVDYLVYEYVPLPGEQKAAAGAQQRLGCFVSRKGKPTAYLDLGPLGPVTEAVEAWRRAIRRRSGGFDRGMVLDEPAGDGGSGVPQIALRKRVWAPIEPYLDKAEMVLLSPDGPLCSAPFAALPGSRPGSYLLEEFPLLLAPIPRLIVPLTSHTEPLDKGAGGMWSLKEARPKLLETPLLIGDVDFDADAGPAGPAATGGPPRTTFPPLPGTAQEIEKIDDLFRSQFPDRSADRLTGDRATNTAFRAEAPRHRWIHLATHGYFARGRAADEAAPAELRSAIALAGASRGADEGRLTALEVSSLDLDQVDLAVLSACETGLGEVEEGEGVLGLQRAFLVAGVKSTAASLWSIDDAATQALMAEFYRNLWQQNLSPAEALRQAQLAMLAGRLYLPPGLDKAPGEGAAARLPPYFWAAFLLGGDCHANGGQKP